MPYRKVFISEQSWPDTVVLPLPDDFPDPRILTEYLEAPGSLLVIQDTRLTRKEAERKVRDLATDFRKHLGQVGCLTDHGTVVWGKVMPCRIDPDGLFQWLAESRDQMRGVYPDRPPDVDTETTRSWVQHPAEIGDALVPQQGVVKPGEYDLSYPVYTLTQVREDEAVMKLLISWQRKDDSVGEYVARVKTQDPKDGRIVFDVEAKADDDDPNFWSRMEVIIAAFANVAGDSPAMVTTYTDFQEMMAESDTATKELKEYYEAELLRRPMAAAAYS